jgi:hypothetical protein
LVGFPARVRIAGSLAYVLDEGGIDALEVSDPARIASLARLEPAGRARNVTLHGGRLYLAMGVAGVAALPLPCGPTPIAILDLEAHAEAEGIRLRWTADEAFTGFTVSRATQSATGWEDFVSVRDAPRRDGSDHWWFLDRDVRPEETYLYRVSGLVGGTVVVRDVVARAIGPATLRLLASPNPARGRVHLRFDLPTRARVELGVWDLKGRHVRTVVVAPLHAGPHAATWDGRDDEGRQVASGVYFARLRAVGANGTSARDLRVTLLR